MTDINEMKFSSVEFYDNGIAIKAKLGVDKYQNIYIKNKDIKAIISKFSNTINYSVSSSESDDVVKNYTFDSDGDVIEEASY